MSDYCYCDYDGEPPEFMHETMSKARKEHCCSECGGRIERGETYRATRGKWDGDVKTYKACPDCLELMAWAEAHVKCICWYFGDAHQNILDEMSNWEKECPGLAAEASERMRAIRLKRREPSSRAV